MKLNEVLYCELTEGSTIQRMKTSHNLGRCCGLRYLKRTDSGGVKVLAKSDFLPSILGACGSK